MKSNKKLIVQSVAAAMAMASTSAFAGSWATETSIAGMDVHIYTPDTVSSVGNGNAVLIALHGCAQTGDDMKAGGNLEVVAEQYGMIVAAPTAPGGGVGIYGCWDYYDSNHTRSNRHNDNLIQLGQYMAGVSGVDPTQVYIAGLSSGATQSQVTACLAPELFAGIGSTGGPTMGTAESQAFVFGGSASTAASLCQQWAGSNASYLASQVWNIAHGDADGLVPYSYAGQNIDALKIVKGNISQVDSNSPAGATELVYGDGTLTKLTYAGMDHRWAAGGGSGGGTYIDHSTSRINWGLYLGELFKNNNSRVDTNAAPVVTLNGDSTVVLMAGTSWTDPGATASDEEDGDVSASIVVSGDTVDTNTINESGYQVVYTATDSESATGDVTRTVKVLDGASNSAPEVTLNGAASMTVTIGDTWTDPGATASDAEDGDLTNSISVSGSVDTNTSGTYTVTYSVSDYGTQLNGQTGTAQSASVTRTVTVSQACWTAPTSEHVAAGRAETSGGYVCLTVGGGDQLPQYSYTCEYVINYGGDTVFSIQETSEGYFNKVADCSTPQAPADSDGDGVADSSDNCVNDANANQADADSDGIGDVCDPTPNGETQPSDVDGDGVADTADNCPNDANANQADNDNDGIGNVCDATPDGEPTFNCTETTAANYYHVQDGRATTDGSYAYAVGSGTNLGLYNTFTTTTLAETSEGHYEQGACP